MLYLGIDQHRKQLTVNLRNEQGDVVLKRQVSTPWDRVRKFFGDLRQRAQPAGGFVAIVEACGFNQWLLEILDEYGCREIVLIQPENRSKKKTGRREAYAKRHARMPLTRKTLSGIGHRRAMSPAAHVQNREITRRPSHNARLKR